MASPFVGITWISRGDLNRLVQDAMANESKERTRLMDAQSEFYRRVNGVTDYKRRFLIFKEVASKYDYREEFFLEKVNI